ncbi:monocarboxylate transporter 7-like [Physella acuta]|uniref:monocarboxylate transporter 7-like n=1 Tax=Physella acuta TaxID=109671 RepID=UPI0027DC9EC7|nr:monocarboxylate transporter 7-like [Physella acuta]
MNSGSERTLPIDRGWAWVICFAGFIIHFMFGSAGQTHAILLGELIEKFSTTITTISFIFTGGILTFSIVSVVSASFLLPRIGERWCLILGGLSCTLVSIGQGHTTHVGVMIALECCRGLCHGIIFVPSICLIRKYFDKRRSTASVIVFCGGCFASIVGPFIIRAIKKEYGIAGTYTLLGALELHFVLAGLLLRPVTFYKQPVEVLNVDMDVIPADLESQTIALPEHQVEKPLSNGTETNGQTKFLDTPGRLLRSRSVEEQTSRPFLRTRTFSVESEGEVDSKPNMMLGSVLSLTSELGAALQNVSADSRPAASPLASRGGASRTAALAKFYYDACLNLWGFRVALLAIIPGTANVYMAIYLPMVLNSLGASLDDVSILLTIVGVTDLLSRLVMGFIADTHVLSSTVMLIISQIFFAILCQLVWLFTTFETLIVLVLLLGLVIGSRISLLSLVVIEVVGVEKMPQAFSFISMVSTVAAAAVNPALGAVTEATGSFIVSLHIVGGCYFLGGALFTVVPRLVRMDIKHGRRS